MTKVVEPIWGAAQESDFRFIAEVEWQHEDYQFDLTRIYQDIETHEIFYAEDSGCSCPLPFEDTKAEDLKPIRRMQDWYDHVESRIVKPDGGKYQRPAPTGTATFDQIEYARKELSRLLKGNR